jgi:hypothetical protein
MLWRVGTESLDPAGMLRRLNHRLRNPWLATHNSVVAGEKCEDLLISHRRRIDLAGCDIMAGGCLHSRQWMSFKPERTGGRDRI